MIVELNKKYELLKITLQIYFCLNGDEGNMNVCIF